MVAVAAMVALLLTASGENSKQHSSGLDKAMERELAAQARVAFLQKVYAPVEAQLEAGNPQAALLHLDEVGRNYPGDAYGFILRGEILRGMGVLDQAISNYVQAVKIDGHYLDETGLLSRRTEIRQLVDQGLSELAPKVQANPDNRSLVTTLRELHYLQSRLAGGCE